MNEGVTLGVEETVVSRDRQREIEKEWGEKERETELPRWLAMQIFLI